MRVQTALLVCLVLLFPCGNTAIGQGAEAASGASDNLSGPAISKAVPGSMSRGYFVQNEGQLDNPDILYYTTGPLSVYFGASSVTFRATGAPAPVFAVSGVLPVHPASDSIPFHIFRMVFPGSATVLPRAEIPSGPRISYFRGPDPERWVTGAGTFSQIVYGNIYPDTDLKFHWGAAGLKYDFIVRPGGDPESIRVAYEGAVPSLSSDGMVLSTSVGEIRDTGLFVYQETGGRSVETPARLLLSDDTVRFDIPSYDRARPLVIDPLIFSTFVGGSGQDYPAAIALDPSGNIVMAGETLSPDFPVTPGAYNKTYHQGGSRPYYDIFVSKLKSDGRSLLYSTYIGSSKDDYVHGLSVDGSGNIFLAGNSFDFDFPTTIGAFDRSFGGYSDTIVVKLNSNCSVLLYSTFVGGDYVDHGYAIAIDDEGCAYVTGSTTSFDFPVTRGAYDTTIAAGWDYQDAYVYKLAANGSKLEYSTFIGGPNTDWGLAIAIDGAGRVFVTGETKSSDFPVTSGAYDTVYGWAGDVFVSRLSRNGSFLEYSTFLGGVDEDCASSIALGRDGTVLVGGTTRSMDFPVSADAPDRWFSGSSDAFVTAFNISGGGIIHSTFIGGTGYETAGALAVDLSGKVLLAGTTHSGDLAVSPMADWKKPGGGDDAFLARLNMKGDHLTYLSYIGGSDNDSARGLALDGAGDAYITGSTGSADFPVTNTSYNHTFNGPGEQAYLLKVSMISTPSAPVFSLSGGDTNVTLSWKPPAEGASTVTDYILYRGNRSTNLVCFRSVIGTAHSYADSGLTNGELYFYLMVAINSSGEGTPSDIKWAMAGIPPSEPVNLRALSSRNRVELSWSAPLDTRDLPVLNYRVYRNVAGRWIDRIAETPDTWYNDTQVSNGWLYTYSICAVNVIGEGPHSADASAFPADRPYAPGNLTARVFGRDVCLGWENPPSSWGGVVSGFNIYRRAEGKRWDILSKTVSTAFLDTSLNTGNYFYRVAAFYDGGEGYVSGEIPVGIDNQRPGADFTLSPGRGNSSTEFYFTSLTFDPDGTVIGWRWSFGDGTYSNKQDTEHNFPRRGVYNVTLTVSDDEGGETTVARTVSIINTPPSVARFSPGNSGTIPVKNGGEVWFEINGSDPDTDTLSITWHLDDKPAGSGPKTNIVFTGPGTHLVRGRLSDGEAVAEAVWTVIVAPPPAPPAPQNRMWTVPAMLGVLLLAAAVWTRRRGKTEPVARPVPLRSPLPVQQAPVGVGPQAPVRAGPQGPSFQAVPPAPVLPGNLEDVRRAENATGTVPGPVPKTAPVPAGPAANAPVTEKGARKKKIRKAR